MPLSTHVHETELRVRYVETDAAGIVHHAAFVAWLEVGRVEWLRAEGVEYLGLERAGYSLPVVELFLRYVAPARFDDLLRVRVALADARSRSVTFAYEVLTASEPARQLANGHSKHICLFEGRVAPMPAELRSLAGS
jgi:acyl-CoA thioester hydrolase